MYNTGKILGATTTAGIATGAVSQLPQTSGNLLVLGAVMVVAFLTVWAVSYVVLEKTFNRNK